MFLSIEIEPTLTLETIPFGFRTLKIHIENGPTSVQSDGIRITFIFFITCLHTLAKAIGLTNEFDDVSMMCETIC